MRFIPNKLFLFICFVLWLSGLIAGYFIAGLVGAALGTQISVLLVICLSPFGKRYYE